MPVIRTEIVSSKIQTKMNDCWYACIQMARSQDNGIKSKPVGATTLAHRDRFFVGRKLNFSSGDGPRIAAENNLIDISILREANRQVIDLTDIDTFYRAIQKYNLLIIGGQFGCFNTMGHFIVVNGVDTGSGNVYIYDPAWGHGEATKTWEYITKYIWKMGGDDSSPACGAVMVYNNE